MMRGLIVFITAIFSIVFLKRVLYRHHYTALLLIVGGIGLVGVASVMGEKKKEGDGLTETSAGM
jgi:drug/metabolite transporter (DMT)-like permease